MSTPVKSPKQPASFSTLDPEFKYGHRLKFERRITLLALLAGFPAVGLCAFLLWYDGYSAQIQWTVDLLLTLLWLGVSFSLKTRIVRPLQTLSNILAAIREGDYSIRGRRALSGDALGEVMLEVNDLGQTLREQRLGAMEATALLRTVMLKHFTDRQLDIDPKLLEFMALRIDRSLEAAAAAVEAVDRAALAAGRKISRQLVVEALQGRAAAE